MPLRPSSTHPSISEGGRSWVLLASNTRVLPWMISRTNAVLRFAVQRLVSSSINVLMVSFSRR